MRTTAVLFLVFIFCSSVFAQPPRPKIDKLPTELQKETNCLNPEFLIFSLHSSGEKKVPIVIYLHGAGGVGDDINRIKGQPMGVCRGVQTFQKGPCIIVAPQCLRTSKQGKRGIWNADDLNVLLRHLKATLPIDECRIYLTGNSMGGYGSWMWGGSNPEHFAAIAPIVGGIGPAGPKDITDELTEWATNLAKIPVYAFAGGNDKVVPADRSETMVKEIKKAGGKLAKLKVYPNEGHNASRAVFKEREYFDWMFEQKKKATK
jgi:predicted peptidase